MTAAQQQASSGTELVASIVMPTHNRASLLPAGLAALAAQTVAPGCFEVIVVADACTDDTAAVLDALAPTVPYPLRQLTSNARRASVARNSGAEAAKAPLLVFVDDDIVVDPGFLAAHVDAHRRSRADCAVLGYSKPALPARRSWWQQEARLWWEDVFAEMARDDHRFTFRDFFSGNCSLSAELFKRVGGFDPSLRGRLEDYELGVRLLKLDVAFRFEPTASGVHHDDTDFVGWLTRSRQEGVSHIQIGERHPELRTMLFGNVAQRPDTRGLRALQRLAFDRPTVAVWVLRALLAEARLLERARLRRRWRVARDALRLGHYWLGIAEELPSRASLAGWLQQADPVPAVAAHSPVIEWAGVEAGSVPAETLARASELGARVVVDGLELAAVPPQPGAEPVRVEHLRRAVRDQAGQTFLPGLAWLAARAAAAPGVEGGAHADQV